MTIAYRFLQFLRIHNRYGYRYLGVYFNRYLVVCSYRFGQYLHRLFLQSAPDSFGTLRIRVFPRNGGCSSPFGEYRHRDRSPQSCCHRPLCILHNPNFPRLRFLQMDPCASSSLGFAHRRFLRNGSASLMACWTCPQFPRSGCSACF